MKVACSQREDELLRELGDAYKVCEGLYDIFLACIPHPEIDKRLRGNQELGYAIQIMGARVMRYRMRLKGGEPAGQSAVAVLADEPIALL